MNKVRISGNLLKIDKGKIRKYRCVIRSGFFFAYLNNQADDATVVEFNHFQQAEITLAVVTLTATTYILPTAINSSLTPYVLQLSSFETSQKLFFYVNCAASLESWIEAIRAESYNDDLSLDVEQGELLPPTANDDESSLCRSEDDGSSYNLTSSPFSQTAKVPHKDSSVRRMLLEEASFLRNEDTGYKDRKHLSCRRKQEPTDYYQRLEEKRKRSSIKSFKILQLSAGNLRAYRTADHNNIENYGLFNRQIAMKCSEQIKRKRKSSFNQRQNLHVTFVETSPKSAEQRSSEENQTNNTPGNSVSPHQDNVTRQVYTSNGNMSELSTKERSDFSIRKLVPNKATESSVCHPITAITTLTNLIKRRNNQEKAKKRQIAERPSDLKISTQHKIFPDTSSATSVVKARGWLHCKSNSETWSAAWVVLTTNNQLLFYDENSNYADLNSSYDLSNGCSVENISFGKWCTAFTMVYQPTANAIRSKAASASTSSFQNDSKASQHEYGKFSSKKIHLMCSDLVQFVSWMRALASINYNNDWLSMNGHHPIRRTVRLLNRDAVAFSFDNARQFNTKTPSTNGDDVRNRNRAGTTGSVNKTAMKHDEVSVNNSDCSSYSVQEFSSMSSNASDVFLCDQHQSAVISEKKNKQLNKLPSHDQCKRSIKAHYVNANGHSVPEQCSVSDGVVPSSEPGESDPTTCTLKGGKVATAKINRDPLFSSYFASASNTSAKYDRVQPSSYSQLLHSQSKASNCTGRVLLASSKSGSRNHSNSGNGADQESRFSRFTIQPQQQQQQASEQSPASSFQIKEKFNLFKSWSEPCLAHSHHQHFSRLESFSPSLRKSLICTMRNTKSKLPELSRVEFLEMYGFTSKKTQDKKFTSKKQKSKSFSAKTFQEEENDQTPFGAKMNSYDNSKKSKINRTRNLSMRSIPSTKIKDEKKASGKWFKKHSFRLPSRPIVSQEKSYCKSDEEYHQYASKTLAYMGAEDQRQHGFLSLRNKKKNWDRYWCVLSNDVLEFYDKPQSTIPIQTLTLTGYEYVADVSASTQKHFAIKAEKKGSPTYHFGTDDFEDIVAWMRRLDKRHVPTESKLDGKAKAQTLPTLSFKKEFMRRSEGDLSNQTFDRSVALQKHKLLQEIEVEKKKILKELNILEKQNSGLPPSPSTSSTSKSPKLGSCNHFPLPDQDTMESYEEEQKVTRYMALLHRRRNSQQLKIDQVSRELTTIKRPSLKKKKSRKAGGSGDKLRNGQSGPDSEAVQKQKTPLVFKLIEMRQELTTINQEIKRVHTFKKSFLEKLDERVDAEKLSQKPSMRDANQLLAKSLSQTSENNLISDTVSLSNASTIESLNSLEDPSTTTSSSSSSEHIGCDDVNCDRPPLCKTKSLEPTINNKIISLVEMDKKHGWKSSEYLPDCTSPSSKVDPSVLASIQMFEKFSAMTLAKIKSQKTKISK